MGFYFTAEPYFKLPSTQIRWLSLVIETPWVTSPSSRTFPRMLPPRMPWERWGQGDKRLESCTWTRNWQRLTRRPRGGGPQLCAEYTVDVYAYLRNLEPSSTVKANHLLGCSINDKMRAVLVDWLVEVQVQFKLLQETLFSTISIVDRFLAV